MLRTYRNSDNSRCRDRGFAIRGLSQQNRKRVVVFLTMPHWGPHALLQGYISKRNDAGFWYHSTGGCQYECYGSAGLLGVVVIEFWTVNVSYRVKCKLHKSRCQKLVGGKGRTIEQMLDLLGKWLSVGPTLNDADHFSCRPA